MPENTQAQGSELSGKLDRCLFCGSEALEDEPDAFLVEWTPGDGLTWVKAEVSELNAVDEARRHKGTVTPLYRKRAV